jgi:hypothetical protein
MISADDHSAICRLLNLHGHLMDEGNLEELDQLFMNDVVYDLEDFGRGSLSGIAAIRGAALALGDLNPVAHHITNVVLTEIADGVIAARCKGIGVQSNGTVGSVTYEDTIRSTESGWHIARRKVIARRRPLGAA